MVIRNIPFGLKILAESELINKFIIIDILSYILFKFFSKVTAIVDSKGIPLNVCLSSGNKHDCTIFKENQNMIGKARGKDAYFMADKGYDSEEIRDILREKEYIPIIPKRRSKKNKRSLKRSEIKIYRKRIIVENSFAWLKRNAKIDKIYEKSEESYMALLLLSISMLIYKRT